MPPMIRHLHTDLTIHTGSGISAQEVKRTPHKRSLTESLLSSAGPCLILFYPLLVCFTRGLPRK